MNDLTTIRPHLEAILDDCRDAEGALRKARIWMEGQEKGLFSSTTTISLECQFHINHGDMSLCWKVVQYGGAGQEFITVKASMLQDALQECKRQREVAKKLAPLSLPRVADTETPF